MLGVWLRENPAWRVPIIAQDIGREENDNGREDSANTGHGCLELKKGSKIN
jgi:hypothetical protein